MALAHFKIPTGWTVAWNTLPEPANGRDLPPYDDLTEDLLLLENQRRGVIIDLGWYPELDPKGKFVLRAIKLPANEENGAESWENPLRVHEGCSYAEIRSALEEWLEDQSLAVLPQYGEEA